MRPDIDPQKILCPLPPERIRRYRRYMGDDIPRGELDNVRGPIQIGLIGLAVFFGGFFALARLRADVGWSRRASAQRRETTRRCGSSTAALPSKLIVVKAPGTLALTNVMFLKASQRRLLALPGRRRRPLERPGRVDRTRSDGNLNVVFLEVG